MFTRFTLLHDLSNLANCNLTALIINYLTPFHTYIIKPPTNEIAYTTSPLLIIFVFEIKQLLAELKIKFIQIITKKIKLKEIKAIKLKNFAMQI